MFICLDVLIRVNYCGICGTDLHFWSHGLMGNKELSKPPILGHEASGTVERVGSAVTHLKPGDRVAIEPNVYCGDCSLCRQGKNNLCQADNVEIPPRDGLFQEYFVHPAVFTHKIPDTMSLEVAAFAEPLACVLHGVIRSKLQAGDDVLVCGAGPVGLLAAISARAFGAGNIVITDINPLRLQVAKALGIHNTYLVSRDKSNEQATKEVLKLLPSAPRITLECTGFESSMQLAISATGLDGKIALIGLGATQVNVPLSTASLKELELIGSSKYRNTFQLSLKMMASKQIDPSSIISHKIKLANLPEAFEMLAKGQGCKILIEC